MRMHNPSHPGRILRDDIGGRGLTVTAFAAHLGISRVMLSRVLNGSAGITAEMSIKLSEALNTSPDLWFKMQNAHDFWRASQGRRKRVKLLDAAA